MTTGKSYSYADAGVSIAAGNTFVKAISSLVKATARPGADAEIGGFGAFFDPKAAGFNDPLLVAATWQHQRRLALHGSDRSWLGSSPPSIRTEATP